MDMVIHRAIPSMTTRQLTALTSATLQILPSYAVNEKRTFCDCRISPLQFHAFETIIKLNV